MIQRDYLIIGSGIGGASACEGIRRYDKRGSVTLIGAEVFPPYKRWILSKSFLREKNPQLKKLQEPAERWFRAHKIETRFGTVVTQFNIDRRLAVLANGESIEFNKACLAMGSRPVRPQVAGVGLGNVIYLRTVRDALALKEMANVERTVMVVGGGLLACEAAASLRTIKLKVGLMHRDSYLLNRYLDAETGAWLTDYFAKHGVTMSMGESLNGFEGKTVLRNIQTKSGNRFPVGLAVVACGAEPNLDLVRNTPLAGPHGSPVTDYLETGFRRRLQRVADPCRSSRHVREEKIRRALLSGREAARHPALSTTSPRSEIGQDPVAPRSGEVVSADAGYGTNHWQRNGPRDKFI